MERRVASTSALAVFALMRDNALGSIFAGTSDPQPRTIESDPPPRRGAYNEIKEWPGPPFCGPLPCNPLGNVLRFSCSFF